ncbi:MAG: hypothetical protein DRJ18_00600 [Candidatus Methanomethylicota archaeon]|nr:MAG: hypothetical protein DRJ18_00600 [Candidatus Verstraetearchaeota archaeon]
MRVKNIPLSQINPPAFDIRARRSPKKVEALAADIAKRGLLEPIKVREVEGGKYEVVDGLTRFLAVESLGWKQVPAIVTEADDVTAVIVAYVENAKRQNVGASDTVRVLDYLCNKVGMKQREACEKLGIRPETASRYLKVLERLPEEQREQVLNGEMSVRKALERAGVVKPKEVELPECELYENAVEITVKSEADYEALKNVISAVRPPRLKLFCNGVKYTIEVGRWLIRVNLLERPEEGGE